MSSRIARGVGSSGGKCAPLCSNQCQCEMNASERGRQCLGFHLYRREVVIASTYVNFI